MIRLLIVTLLFISCQEKVPELKSLGENNINESNKFKATETIYYITDPSSALTISGVCDPRYTEMEVSFDNQTNWKLFSAAATTNTDSDCSDSKFSLYLDQINNYFTYDTGVVGNQSKYLHIRGNLGFTYSTPIKITIQNGDFNSPAKPVIKTLSSFTFAKIYIEDNTTDSDFSHFQCKVDSGAWFTCANDDVITSDGTTEIIKGTEGTITVRAVDNTGNVSDEVSKIFKRGRLGRGVNGAIYAIEEIEPGKYLIGGDFEYYNPTPVEGLARLNTSDYSLDHSFQPDLSSLSNVVDEIFYDNTRDRFLLKRTGSIYFYDSSFNYLKSEVIYPPAGSNASLIGKQLDNDIYFKYSNGLYKTNIGDSLSLNANSINIGSSFDYSATSNALYIRTGTGQSTSFCIKKYNLDLSGAGTDVICNNPADFKLGTRNLHTDITGKYIARSMKAYGDSIYIQGDFDEYNGADYPNCIMKYDGSNFSSFGEDINLLNPDPDQYQFCSRNYSLFILGNQLYTMLHSKLFGSSPTSRGALNFNLDTGLRNTNFNSTIIPTDFQSSGLNFINDDVIYNPNGQQVLNLFNLTRSTTAKYYTKNNFLYLYNSINFVAEPTKSTSSLLLVDKYGNILKTFNGDATEVTVIKKHNNKIYVAGSFNSFEGRPYKNLIRFNIDMSVDTNFPNLEFNSMVTDIAFDNSERLYVAGAFTSGKDLVGTSFARKNLVRYTSELMFDSTFINLTSISMSSATTFGRRPKIYLDETDLDSNNHSLYLGGSYSSINSHTTKALSKIFLNGTLDTNFSITSGTIQMWSISPTPNGSHLAIIIAGGHSINGNNCQVCIIDKNTGIFVQSLSSSTSVDIKLHENKLYLYGRDFTIFDQTYNQVNSKTIYTAYTGLIDSENNIVIGGEFNNVGSQKRFNLIKLNSDFTINTDAFGDYR